MVRDPRIEDLSETTEYSVLQTFDENYETISSEEDEINTSGHVQFRGLNRSRSKNATPVTNQSGNLQLYSVEDCEQEISE